MSLLSVTVYIAADIIVPHVMSCIYVPGCLEEGWELVCGYLVTIQDQLPRIQVVVMTAVTMATIIT